MQLCFWGVLEVLEGCTLDAGVLGKGLVLALRMRWAAELVGAAQKFFFFFFSSWQRRRVGLVGGTLYVHVSGTGEREDFSALYVWQVIENFFFFFFALRHRCISEQQQHASVQR